MKDVSRLEAEDRAWILPRNGKKTLEAIRARWLVSYRASGLPVAGAAIPDSRAIQTFVTCRQFTQGCRTD